ncbi:glucose transporter type 1-like isoform X2 [Pollicipes pollicipes]|uniref:glucose transporter type 1-like isoform X2 n=1 Tax=Pollicipes pollicipes TaxID=41117 RepID=UPI0018859AE7|nr:glucose transporter type 1-like isoform X2 [Pollicipes pollicipes]
MLRSLQKQVTTMSRNLSAKLDSIQADRYMETSAQLKVIRSQLRDLTSSVVSCQTEVTEVRKDVHMIRHEIDQLQSAKDEMEELRDCVERLEEEQRRRKARSIDQGLTLFLVSAIFSAVLGMFQFGYNTGVINAPQHIIEDFIKNVWRTRYGTTIQSSTLDFVWSVAVSIFAIGGMVGGFSGAYIANRFGRKGGLLLNDLVGIVGAGLMGLSHLSSSFEMLIIGRLVIGYNCGLSTSLVPMYVSEIAPVNLRGGVGIVNQLAVTIGLLLSQVLGLTQLLGTDDGWPLLLGLAVCPSALQLVLLPMCPESPRYLLITKQKEQEARKALRQLRHCNNIEDDVEEMKTEERAQQAEARFTMLQLVKSPALRSPLIIAIVMQLSQQLSGINAVFYYSTDIFVDAHLSAQGASYATMGVGVVMVLMTVVSILLIEREGRRTLHLWGLGGMFFFSVFITISFLVKQMISWVSYLAVICTFGFVVFFAVGPGSIPWMITAELFSQGPRPAAMSIAVLINWLCNFIVGIAFLPMKNLLEDYTFLPFSLLLAIFWGFTFKRVPETKGKTFEEIAALFRQAQSPPPPYGAESGADNGAYQSSSRL